MFADEEVESQYNIRRTVVSFRQEADMDDHDEVRSRAMKLLLTISPHGAAASSVMAARLELGRLRTIPSLSLTSRSTRGAQQECLEECQSCQDLMPLVVVLARTEQRRPTAVARATLARLAGRALAFSSTAISASDSRHLYILIPASPICMHIAWKHEHYNSTT